MKKILTIVAFVLLAGALFAQTDSVELQRTDRPNNELIVSEPAKKPKKKYDLSSRANDHFLVQLGYTNWMDIPDSIKTKGFSRSINAYFMLDFPFKTSQQLSLAIGVGVGTDHVFLDDNFADVKGISSTLRFEKPENLSVKKTKVTTAYAEIPVELRFVANPGHSDKSFKLALGGKVGTLIKGGTRSRVTEPGTQANYLLKENSKDYFNNIRIAGTARIGYGHFTLFGSYQFTSLLKTGVGPQLKPYTIGISFGGL